MRLLSTLLAALLLSFPIHAIAQSDEDSASGAGGKPQQPAASTTTGPDTPLDVLSTTVKPMTRAELEIEVKAWFQLLRAHAGVIAEKHSSAEKAVLAAEDTAATGTAVPAEAADSEGDQTVDDLVSLKQEQTSLIERFEVVLKSFEQKGGDVEEYRQYITAQRGVDLTSSNASETWSTIKAWMLSAEGGMRWAWRIGAFLLILFVTKLVAGIVAALVRKWLNRTSHMSKLAESLISRSIRHVIMLLGTLIALTALGINIGPLLAAVGATGFIIGFALQGTLSNFASGLMILLNHPFDVGDVVTAGGVTGTVSEMSLVSTTFSTFDNQKIIVPNNEIWDNVITNVTARDTRRVDLLFCVGYEDDLDLVTQILKESASAHPLVLADPEPVVRMNELADSSVNFICRPWVNATDYWSVYWDLLKTVKNRFDESGVSIPYPQQDVHVKTGQQPVG